MSTKETIKEILKIADIEINGTRPWDIQVKDERFYKRVLRSGTLGLGESYMDGWWDVENLDQFTCRATKVNLKKQIKPSLSLIITWIKNFFFNTQTIRGSQKVVRKHYDLSPEFYMSFLDPYNQYTCGYFKNTKDLNKAQEQKLDLISRKLKLRPEDKVLDIGSGWGGLAKFISEKYGSHITGLTISLEQEKWSKKFTSGLNVEILNKDYRKMLSPEMKEKFDKVTVVGMIEHVGYKNYRNFIKIVNHVLKKDGLFLLHTIGRKKSKRFGELWIQKYIFPNSMIPSQKQLASAFEDFFTIEDWHNFGVHYDQTLMAWFINFDKNWHKFKNQYGNKFYRMWKFYLLVSAGLFRARKLQLWQIVLSKKSLTGGYESVR